MERIEPFEADRNRCQPHCRLLGSLIIAMALGGCSPSPSPLVRLEQDAPVDRTRLLVSDVTLNGERLPDGVVQWRAVPGANIEWAGSLRPGTIGTSGIAPIWLPRAGEPQEVTTSVIRTSADPIAMLMMYIQGSNPAKNAGVVHSLMVESRPVPSSGGQLEMRANFSAPQKRGIYVVDLSFLDQTATGVRGRTRTTPPGVSIWRVELVVE